MSGPLAGIRVLELGGKGPTPFAGMMLADLGAEVVAIERAGSALADAVFSRGKVRLELDLKAPEAQRAVAVAIGRSDVLIEGFRPGVAERIGFGPAEMLAANPRLVYGRMTGFGQGTSWSGIAGHDLNFIALSSALAHIGPPSTPPVVPLNLVGDFGGGGMFLVVGVLAALVERATSGRGQVVDAATIDGSALLMASIFAMRAAGQWSPGRQSNLVDGGAPFYRSYATSDGHFLSVGALDPGHYRELMRVCGIDDPPAQDDRGAWPALTERLSALFGSASRDEWVARFEGVAASVAPVLTMDEVATHPFHVERGTFLERGGVLQPAPAPRFDRTPGEIAPALMDAAGRLERFGFPKGFGAGAVAG